MSNKMQRTAIYTIILRYKDWSSLYQGQKHRCKESGILFKSNRYQSACSTINSFALKDTHATVNENEGKTSTTCSNTCRINVVIRIAMHQEEKH